MSGGPGPPPSSGNHRSGTPGGWSPLHFRPGSPYAPSPPPRMGSPAANMFGNRLPYGMPCPRPRWPAPMSPVPVPPHPHAFSPPPPGPPPGPKPFRRPLHPVILWIHLTRPGKLQNMD
uniref:Basic proline-rich protein-like n=1 Tax=Diabrotica virgifera virgifera TaxID=50390 RepID=A0A6P7H536_DIAVI